MKKFLLPVVIVIIIVILIIRGVFVYQKFKAEETKTTFISMSDLNLKDKKIAMIISFREFRDEEYFIPKEIFESAGAEIFTVSSSLGKAIGKLGGETDVNILLENLNVAEYDAILFVGGPGAQGYIENETCHKIARETVNSQKVLGAICIAPAILAKAGVLEGKKATVWNSIMDKSAVNILKDNGADFQDISVVIDGKIVTASGPQAAKEFAEAIINLLKQ